jgi:hypothetical protein
LGSAAKPGRVGVVGRGQGLPAGVVDRVGSPEMHRRRGMPSDPGMAMNIIVLIEEVYRNCFACSNDTK